MPDIDATAGVEGAASRRQAVKGFSRLAPALHLRPEPSPRIKLLPPTDEDVNLLLQRVGIRRRGADIVDALPKLFEFFPPVVKHDHAVPRVAARSPEKPGLVPAERSRQACALAEKIDGPGVAIV